MFGRRPRKYGSMYRGDRRRSWKHRDDLDVYRPNHDDSSSPEYYQAYDRHRVYEQGYYSKSPMNNQYHYYGYNDYATTQYNRYSGRQPYESNHVPPNQRTNDSACINHQVLANVPAHARRNESGAKSTSFEDVSDTDLNDSLNHDVEERHKRKLADKNVGDETTCKKVCHNDSVTTTKKNLLRLKCNETIDLTDDDNFKSSNNTKNQKSERNVSTLKLQKDTTVSIQQPLIVNSSNVVQEITKTTDTNVLVLAVKRLCAAQKVKTAEPVTILETVSKTGENVVEKSHSVIQNNNVPLSTANSTKVSKKTNAADQPHHLNENIRMTNVQPATVSLNVSNEKIVAVQLLHDPEKLKKAKAVTVLKTTTSKTDTDGVEQSGSATQNVSSATQLTSSSSTKPDAKAAEQPYRLSENIKTTTTSFQQASTSSKSNTKVAADHLSQTIQKVPTAKPVMISAAASKPDLEVLQKSGNVSAQLLSSSSNYLKVAKVDTKVAQQSLTKFDGKLITERLSRVYEKVKSDKSATVLIENLKTINVRGKPVSTSNIRVQPKDDIQQKNLPERSMCVTHDLKPASNVISNGNGDKTRSGEKQTNRIRKSEDKSERVNSSERNKMERSSNTDSTKSRNSNGPNQYHNKKKIDCIKESHRRSISKECDANTVSTTKSKSSDKSRNKDNNELARSTKRQRTNSSDSDKKSKKEVNKECGTKRLKIESGKPSLDKNLAKSNCWVKGNVSFDAIKDMLADLSEESASEKLNKCKDTIEHKRQEKKRTKDSKSKSDQNKAKPIKTATDANKTNSDTTTKVSQNSSKQDSTKSSEVIAKNEEKARRKSQVIENGRKSVELEQKSHNEDSKERKSRRDERDESQIPITKPAKRILRRRGKSCDVRTFFTPDLDSPPRSKSVEPYLTNFRITRSQSAFFGLAVGLSPPRRRRSLSSLSCRIEPEKTSDRSMKASEEVKIYKPVEIDMEYTRRPSGSYSPRYDDEVMSYSANAASVSMVQRQADPRDPRKLTQKMNHGRELIKYSDLVKGKTGNELNNSIAVAICTEKSKESSATPTKNIGLGEQTKEIRNILRQEAKIQNTCNNLTTPTTTPKCYKAVQPRIKKNKKCNSPVLNKTNVLQRHSSLKSLGRDMPKLDDSQQSKPSKVNVEIAEIERLFPSEELQDNCIRLNVSDGKAERTVTIRKANVSKLDFVVEKTKLLMKNAIWSATARTYVTSNVLLQKAIVATVLLQEQTEQIVDLTFDDVTEEPSDLTCINDINKLTDEFLDICGEDEKPFILNIVSSDGLLNILEDAQQTPVASSSANQTDVSTLCEFIDSASNQNESPKAKQNEATTTATLSERPSVTQQNLTREQSSVTVIVNSANLQSQQQTPPSASTGVVNTTNSSQNLHQTPPVNVGAVNSQSLRQTPPSVTSDVISAPAISTKPRINNVTQRTPLDTYANVYLNFVADSNRQTEPARTVNVSGTDFLNSANINRNESQQAKLPQGLHRKSVNSIPVPNTSSSASLVNNIPVPNTSVVVTPTTESVVQNSAKKTSSFNVMPSQNRAPLHAEKGLPFPTQSHSNYSSAMQNMLSMYNGVQSRVYTTSENTATSSSHSQFHPSAAVNSVQNTSSVASLNTELNGVPPGLNCSSGARSQNQQNSSHRGHSVNQSIVGSSNQQQSTPEISAYKDFLCTNMLYIMNFHYAAVLINVSLPAFAKALHKVQAKAVLISYVKGFLDIERDKLQTQLRQYYNTVKLSNIHFAKFLKDLDTQLTASGHKVFWKWNLKYLFHLLCDNQTCKVSLDECYKQFTYDLFGFCEHYIGKGQRARKTATKTTEGPVLPKPSSISVVPISTLTGPEQTPSGYTSSTNAAARPSSGSRKYPSSFDCQSSTIGVPSATAPRNNFNANTQILDRRNHLQQVPVHNPTESLPPDPPLSNQSGMLPRQRQQLLQQMEIYKQICRSQQQGPQMTSSINQKTAVPFGSTVHHRSSAEPTNHRTINYGQASAPTATLQKLLTDRHPCGYSQSLHNVIDGRLREQQQTRPPPPYLNKTYQHINQQNPPQTMAVETQVIQPQQVQMDVTQEERILLYKRRMMELAKNKRSPPKQPVEPQARIEVPLNNLIEQEVLQVLTQPHQSPPDQTATQNRTEHTTTHQRLNEYERADNDGALKVEVNVEDRSTRNNMSAVNETGCREFVDFESYLTVSHGDNWDDDIIDIVWPKDFAVLPRLECVKDEENVQQASNDIEEDPIPRNVSNDSGVESPLSMMSPSQLDIPGSLFEDRNCLCGKHAVYVCTCKLVMYCSIVCQMSDWDRHQREHN